MKILVAYPVTPSTEPTFARNQELQDRLFPGAVDGFERVYFQSRREGEPFNLAQLRNEAIMYAVSMGHDWLLLPDVDTIYTNPVEVWPSSGFGQCSVFYAPEGADIAKGVQGFPESKWGWFMVARPVFTWVRFDEEFVGWGYEEHDFFEQVTIGLGVPRTATDLQAIHVWHPQRSKFENSPQNLELLARKRHLRGKPATFLETVKHTQQTGLRA